MFYIDLMIHALYCEEFDLLTMKLQAKHGVERFDTRWEEIRSNNDDFAVLIDEKVSDCFETPFELDAGESQSNFYGGDSEYVVEDWDEEEAGGEEASGEGMTIEEEGPEASSGEGEGASAY